MSYNTRRINTGFGTPQQASSVGQRRPAVSNNFVPGGQLAGSQQQKPQGPPPQQQRPPQQQQQQSTINFRNQPSQQQNYSQNYSNNTQQGRYVQGQQASVVKQESPVKPPPQQQQQPPQQTPQPKPLPQNVAPIVPGANPPPPEHHEDVKEVIGEGTVKRRFWTKANKISRAEKIRRRNLKLSKILQPKNAVMILNELVRGCVYNVEEFPVKVDLNHFKGTVTFDGREFAGTGRTKNAAKNAAAETALKHLVKSKQLTNIRKEEDDDEKMDIGEDDSSQVMPWSHIASFAMYKLFSTWGEDPNMVHRVSAQDIMAGSTSAKPVGGPRDPKPAKKMPDNPETMNPLMLMHQMLPNAVWEEVGKSGNPPNVLFTFSVTIEGKQFVGAGSSKKAAKKLAAFSACHEVLKVNYPPDIWSPMY